MMKILNALNIFSWPFKAYGDFKEWNIIRKACKEEGVKKILEEKELRVDNIYRIYTIVTVPEDLSLNQNLYWPVLMEKLKPLNETMLRIGISEIVYPRIERIDNTNFLIVLEPEMDYLNIKSLFFWLLKLLGYYLVLGTLNNVLLSLYGIDYLGSVSSFISSLFEYLPI